jgi:hypothetical protein
MHEFLQSQPLSRHRQARRVDLPPRAPKSLWDKLCASPGALPKGYEPGFEVIMQRTPSEKMFVA